MIYQIFSTTLDSFKSQVLRAGCNLIVAEKTAGASDQQTRNSAGKSSLVEIINFVLGSDIDRASIFSTEALKDHRFGMAFDLAGNKVIAERCGSAKSRIFIREGDTASWPHKPKGDDEGRSLSLKEWREILATLIFGIDTDAPKFSPTFRMVAGYFVRARRRTTRGSDDGFLDPRKYSVNMQTWQQQVALAWLLGLDWKIGVAFEEVRSKEKALKSLKKEFKSGVFQNVIGTSASLRSREVVLNDRIAKLEKEIQEFQVLPEYRDLEREGSEIANRLASMANENTQDEETLQGLRSAISEEFPPSGDDLLRVFEEAGTVLAKGVSRRLEEVKAFHDAVIRNRVLHLQAEIGMIEHRLVSRREEMQRIDRRRVEIMRILSTHGALDQYTQIQGELTRHNSEVANVKRHREIAEKIESSKTDLALERATVQKRLQIDVREREESVRNAVLLFESYSKSLSEYEGTLTITPTENGLDVEVQVPGYRGKALTQMQVFCFDLMLCVLMRRRGIGPGFLVHDSHLFDGMDPRQIGTALKLAADASAREGFQYVATFNSDTLESTDLRDHFNPEPYLIESGLTDATEVGGLFGFRFD